MFPFSLVMSFPISFRSFLNTETPLLAVTVAGWLFDTLSRLPGLESLFSLVLEGGFCNS